MKHNSIKLLLSILFLMLIVVHLALVWLLQYFPTQDGPSHIYNLAILKELRSGGAIWGKYYTQELHLFPNLGFHIVAYPLLSFFSPLIVEKLFLSTYIILMAAAILFFLKRFDCPLYPYALLIFPVIFNFSLAMGFYNYVIAIPMMFFGFGCCSSIKNESFAKQFIIINIFAAILYVFHLMSFAIFVLFIIISILVKRNERLSVSIGRLAILLLPSIIVMLHFLLTIRNQPLIRGINYFQRLPTNIVDLSTFSTIYFSRLQIINGLLLLLLAYYLFKKSNQLCAYHEKRIFAIYCSILAFLCLFTPWSIIGGAFFNERIPTIIFLSLIPYCACRQLSDEPYITKLIVGVVICCVGINCYAYYKRASDVNRFLSGRNYAFCSNSIVMAYKRYGFLNSRIDVLVHAVSHYALQHNLVNAGNYETMFYVFPVKFIKKTQELLPDPDIINFHPGSIDFGKYTDIRYLISWDMEPSDNAKKYFIKVFTNSNLSIWHRNMALLHEKADHGPGNVGSRDYWQAGLPHLGADFLR